MYSIRRAVLTALIATLTTSIAARAAGDADAELRLLREQVAALDQKIRVLERQREVDQEISTEKSKTAPLVSIDANGLTVKSADTNFVMRIHGVLQADARFYLDRAPGSATDTFLARRVRPIFDGTVYDRFDYRMLLDFGSGLTSAANNIGFVQEAYVNARISDSLQIRVGKDKLPLSLERLRSDVDLDFMERAFPSSIAPNREIGAQLRGNFASNKVEYQLGVFNGAPDGGSEDFKSTDSGKDGVARLFLQPFLDSKVSALKGLGFGAAGSYGDLRGGLRNYPTPGQQSVFTYFGGTGTTTNSPLVTAGGEHWRVSPQGWYYWGPFGLLGEYIVSDQKLQRNAGPDVSRLRAENSAWQIAGSWFLTGEDNSFRTVTPLRPFRFGGDGWGALQVAVRYSELEIDKGIFPLYANKDQSISEAAEWGVGVNWYLNRLFKLSLDYSQTHFHGGIKNPAASRDEKALLTRVQLSF
jgi:phosphate-selective porin OprO/OprP